MPSSRTLILRAEDPARALESRLTRSRRSEALAVVAPPHPLYGGSLGSPVVKAIERAFADAGLTTLAFNFRGVGESTGEPSGELADALADYRAAATSAADLTLRACAGYSFGSVAALACAAELAAPFVLMVAPPLALLPPELLERARAVVIVAAEHDEYAPLAALHELAAAHAQLTIDVVPGSDHFFLGSAVQRLERALAPVIARALGPSLQT